MLEHTLPISVSKTAIKVTKILVGILFCGTSELVDKTRIQVLKVLNLPNAILNMQDTISGPSDVKLQDVLDDMTQWVEDNA